MITRHAKYKLSDKLFSITKVFLFKARVTIKPGIDIIIPSPSKKSKSKMILQFITFIETK